ncbi:MAG: transketolase [Mycoplasma sp.]
MKKNLENLTINTIRMLGVNAITNANSGHPGIVLGAAPIMYALFKYHLNVDPKNPHFFNRDRFILSAGHGSALLYSTMYLAGYTSLQKNDLLRFRQINSKTPGHPESALVPGIEVSTGPLGQGVAMGVGMAIAEKKLSAIFNQHSKLVDHYTYVLFGDGCFEEGIFAEAVALAGRLKLNKLIMLYDSNRIQLDGKVSDSTNTNVKAFFKANHWNYLKVKDGNDFLAISRAISRAKISNKPTVIEVSTVIGFASNKANSSSCHGAPFKAEEVELIKKNLNYHMNGFNVHNDVEADFKEPIAKRAVKNTIKFNKALGVLEKADVKLYYQFNDCLKNNFGLDLNWYKELQVKPIDATRNTMGKVIDLAWNHLPTLLVGSADLTASTKVGGKHLGNFDLDPMNGQNINYGVREFAMTAISNGINAHGGTRSICSTFLVFSDYAKAAIRLGAVSDIPGIQVYSHDTITVGEDGPTHEPIEQISSLRLIPNHYLFRPCNIHEALFALDFALKQQRHPVTIVTSRGEFNQPEFNDYEQISKGAYVLKKHKSYSLTLLATGSEVAVAMEVSELLAKHKINANVVSVPCLEVFKNQRQEYIDQVLGNKSVISIEYGVTTPWYQYVDLAIGIDSFGKSGKAKDVVDYFDLNPQQITNRIIDWIKAKKKK